MMNNNQKILVTGGGTFLGDHIAAALLTEGADVTLLVRPDFDRDLGVLAQRANIVTGDVWDVASLRGRARGHRVVIHTVGSLAGDPTQGLTHHRMNFVSARNIGTMCVGDGVSEMILMSSVRAPWISRPYIGAKREAEDYLQRVGIKTTIIRAPIAYVRGQKRVFFFELMTFLGSIPILSWLRFGRIAPMPVDMLARGVARVAINPNRSKMMFYAPDLRRLNNSDETKGRSPLSAMPENPARNRGEQQDFHPFELLDDETPFGWIPPDNKN